MRPEPEIETDTVTSAAAARNISQFSPPPPPPPPHSTAAPCNPHVHSCRWWPYSNSNDFGDNAAVIIIVLICALICALALNTAIRWFLRGGSRSPSSLPRTQREVDQQQKPKSQVVAPTLTYSAGMKLGGAEADCAICLGEFVEGEGIRVLGRCKHGFHINCIEQWLSGHSSCPTCRRSCLASSPETAERCPGNGPSDACQPVVPYRLASDHLNTTP